MTLAKQAAVRALKDVMCEVMGMVSTEIIKRSGALVSALRI